MEGLVLLAIVGFVVYALANKSPSAPNHTSTSAPSAQFRSRHTSSFSTTGMFARTTEGFIPTDRCEKCGGAWTKRVHKKNGGRFFSCANYPRCKNNRDKQISDKYCSNGHRRTDFNTRRSPTRRRTCLECHPPQNSMQTSPRSHIPRINNFRGNMESTTSPGPRREYCRNGHERTPANTYTRPDGERECRICRRNTR